MDSLTQLALGASVGEAILGKRIGRKAMLWGGICGTIPDLDVFIPMGNAVADFTYHRSFSHSLFILALLTPLVAWLAMKIHKHQPELRSRWWATVYLVFATHVLLDSFTAYGTQILWPLVTTPVSWSTLFIIDPLYTLPLLVGLIALLVKANSSKHRWNFWGLAISSLYICWSIGVKGYIDNQIHKGLHAQGVEHYNLFTTPAPFNTLLWRGVAKTDSGYYEIYYSIFDDSPPSNNAYYESEEHLLEAIDEQWDVARLKWFSKGFYGVKQLDDKVVISDLRMGSEPFYAFQFAVADIGATHVETGDAIQLQPKRDLSALSMVWDRIWSQDTNIYMGNVTLESVR